MRFTVEGDAPADELAGLVEQSRRRSAVYDVLTNGTESSSTSPPRLTARLTCPTGLPGRPSTRTPAAGRPRTVEHRRCHASTAVVIGAGQAGLAVSALLTDRGVEHVVLERGRAGASAGGHAAGTRCGCSPRTG